MPTNREMTDKAKVLKLWEDAEWSAKYGCVWSPRLAANVGQGNLSGSEWWTEESAAWKAAVSKLPDAAPSVEPSMSSICKFDGHPIYRIGDGEWLHYAEFKGDVLHDPEPAPISPIAEPAKAERCEYCGLPKDNGWSHGRSSGYGDFATISCSAPAAPQPAIDDAPVVEQQKLRTFLESISKHCARCNSTQITTENNEWPLRRRCLDCGYWWIESKPTPTVIPDAKDERETVLTDEQKVKIAWPGAFTWHDDDGTWFVERPKLGEGDSKAEAWADAASRIPQESKPLPSEPQPLEYRFKTSEEAALLPLPLQILRLAEINEQLCRNHNTLLIETPTLSVSSPNSRLNHLSQRRR